MTDVFIVPAEGGEARRVTTDPTADEPPSWSPDGAGVYFIGADFAWEESMSDIWVMDVVR